jgi:membrane protease subunit HflC
MLTQDKKMLQVDAYVCWRVADPTVYVRTMRADETMAKRRLLDAVRSELSAELGNVELSNVISTEAENLKLKDVTESVTAACADVARSDLGIEVRDVGVQRLVFPEQNLESVFARMRAERQRIARKYRAEGEQEAERIKAGADKEKERILAEAYRTAERTKGEGEAEAARTYAAAHSADPRFYKLVRTLQAYERMFGEDTTVVLSADSELLQLMTEGREGLE